MTSFLVLSLVGSIVLTVVLNVVPRLFPGAARRGDDALRRSMERSSPVGERGGVRVWVPWKAMIVASLALTIGLNLLLALLG